MRQILWDRNIGNDCFWHAARVDSLRSSSVIHGHDFAECFWVISGQLSHLVNGEEERLEPGDCVFIRPSDVHGFRQIGRREFSFINIAFPRSVLTHAGHRYASGRDDFFWKEADLPDRQALPEGRRQFLESSALRLAASRQTAAAIDRFLLELFGLFDTDQVAGEIPEHPEWLRNALLGIRDSRRFAVGVSEFVKLAGRSPEHVARTTREVTGKTPSQILNELRLEHAARRLLTSDVPVLELALECGYEEVSHFHRLFRRKFGTSPLQYRRSQSGTIL